MGDEVLHASAALAAAVARGDAAAAASLCTDDGRLLSSAELLTGRGEIEAVWQAGIAFGLSTLDLQTIEVRVNGVVAAEIGEHELAEDGRGLVAEHGKYFALHRRQADGTCRRDNEPRRRRRTRRRRKT